MLNASSAQYPLLNAVIYGDKLSCAKLSKRISCAIKRLPIRVHFCYEYDALKALEAGVTINPTLLLDSKILLEGLVQTEMITKSFEAFLNQLDES